MLSRQRLWQLITIFAVMSLFLAGCVRPSPGGDTGNETPEGQVDATDPNVGGGVGEQDAPPDAAEPDAAPDTGDAGDTADTGDGAVPSGETPRPEGENDTVDPYPAEEGDAGASDADSAADGETAASDGADAADGDGTTDADAADTPADGEDGAEAPAEGDLDEQAGGGTPEDAAAADDGTAADEATGDAAADAAGDAAAPAEDAGTGGPESLSPPAPPAQDGYIVHIVQPGENLFRIGLRYGYSWVVLAQLNGIPNPDRIAVGQAIRIPAPAAPAQPADPGQPTQLPSGVEHTVMTGETLYSIALQYGVPYPDIAAANDLTAPFVVYPGQVLTIPGG